MVYKTDLEKTFDKVALLYFDDLQVLASVVLISANFETSSSLCII